MQVIHKKVSLEQLKNRTKSLLPCYPAMDDNGNWGKFIPDILVSDTAVANIPQTYTLSGKKYIAYKTIMRYYFDIVKILKDANFYKRIARNGGFMWYLYEDDDMDIWDMFEKHHDKGVDMNSMVFESTSATGVEQKEEIITLPNVEYFKKVGGFDTYFFVHSYIGILRIPTDITGIYVPPFIKYAEIKPLIFKLQKIKESDDCCVIKKYEKYGGDAMLDFLVKNATLYDDGIEKWKNRVREESPRFSIHINLNSNEHTLGPVTLDNTYELKTTTSEPHPTSYTSTTAATTLASKLQILKRRKASYDDYGNEIPGTMIPITPPAYYAYKYSGWDFSDKIDNIQSYKNSIVRTFPIDNKELMNTVPGNRNDLITPQYESKLGLQYVEGVVYDGFTIDNKNYGSFIISIDKNKNTEDGLQLIEFVYVIGGQYTIDTNDKVHYVEKTGVKYTESYLFYPEITETFTIDGYDVELTYDKIDFESNAITIYSEDYNLTTVGNGTAVEWQTMDLFAQGLYSDYGYFREDAILGLADTPVVSADIEIDRGNAAAYERHFILTEVNTLEDLEQYKQNFFNI